MNKWNKNKPQLNLIIDGIMFIVMMGITAIGFLIKKVLLPGRVAHSIYGERTEIFFMGLNRHEWGRIHLIMGLILIVLLIFHIVLHWKLIGCIFRKMFKNPVSRFITIIIAGIIPLLFLVLPFLITPQVRPLTPNHFHQTNRLNDLENEATPGLKNENRQQTKTLPGPQRKRRGKMGRP